MIEIDRSIDRSEANGARVESEMMMLDYDRDTVTLLASRPAIAADCVRDISDFDH